MTMVAPWRGYKAQVQRMILSHDHHCRFKHKEDSMVTGWHLDACAYFIHVELISGIFIAAVKQF
jgi:hypothetical protein